MMLGSCCCFVFLDADLATVSTHKVSIDLDMCDVQKSMFSK